MKTALIIFNIFILSYLSMAQYDNLDHRLFKHQKQMELSLDLKGDIENSILSPR